MNTVEQFAEEIKGRIKEYLPEEHRNVKCEIRKVYKNNGVYMTGLTFGDSGRTLRPTVFMDQYFNLYKCTGSMDEILTQLAPLVTGYLETDPRVFDQTTDFEAVRDKLSPMLVNTRDNLQRLQELPYIRIEDLSLICRFDMQVADETGRAEVTKEHLKAWGIGKEELFKQLSENMEKPGLYVLEDVKARIDRILGREDLLINLLEPPGGTLKEPDMQKLIAPDASYVLSNQKNICGAAAMVCPGVMEKVSALFPGGFYILPSSIHECVIVAKTPERRLGVLKEMVWEINCKDVGREEVLSDNVYEYDKERGRIRIAIDPLEKEKGMER